MTLTVSAGPISPDTGTPPRCTAKPVTIPPGGQYSLRLTHLTAQGAGRWCGRSEYFTELSLRVRVGALTRTEILDLSEWIMEIRSSRTDRD